MPKNFFKKKSKKDVLILGGSLAVIFISGALIFYSLTFLIKNINLALKTIPSTEPDLHFNIAGAEKLFPQKQE
ncbi:MAG: hypothetical protein PHF45_01950 [Candidatus Pacebacteria bacterium]|nr:hypothetical protein [Candidatus Paceibacterota bacterium]